MPDGRLLDSVHYGPGKGKLLFGVRELNVAIELWGVAFCTIGIVCAMLFTRGDGRYKGIFIASFALELVASGGDALAGLFRGQAGFVAWVMTHIGNYATFVANFLLVVVLTLYLSSRIVEAGGPSFRPWRVAVTVSALLMSVLALLGAFFYIDESNLYQRTDWYWTALAYAICVNAVNAAIAMWYRRELGNAGFACLLFYSLIPLVTSSMQVIVYGLNYVIVGGMLGLLVLFLEMQTHSAHVLVDQAEELARSQVEVTESRIAVMVSQIQPHFLFNTLDTIYGLCDEDPELAKEAIASFSRYLRTNLDSLNRTSPVPIQTELEHVRTYLELERMSDEDRLEYELDTQALGFNVPALSVQTLAENAVKHGLGQKEQGGKIIVRTRERQTEYTVAVVDDGVGFDQGAINQPRERPAVGLENTRARLAAMCGGTLEVTSELGVGTTVVMHVPKSAPNLMQ